MRKSGEQVVVAAERGGRAARPRARRADRAVALAPQGADPRRRGRDRAPHDPRSRLSRQRRRRRSRSTCRRRSRPSPPAERIPLNVVYEDDDIIVIDKPAGLVVHPAAGHASGTLVNALIAHCGDSLSGIGGVKRPGIVHRLDKDTTGLMVVAKNDARAPVARRAVRRPRPHRAAASAAIWRSPGARSTGPKGTIDAPIDRHPQQPHQDGGARQAAERPSRTGRRWRHSRATSGKPAASLVVCRLTTGRTHQIRVHLAHAGHPLLGDATYATGFKTKAAQLAAAARAGPGGPWKAGPACLSIGHRTPKAGEEAGVPVGTAGRTWLVYITRCVIADARTPEYP